MINPEFVPLSFASIVNTKSCRVMDLQGIAGIQSLLGPVVIPGGQVAMDAGMFA